MTHDSLCPHDKGAYHELGENSCVCDLLAKADARATARTLDKARDAVAALIHSNMCDCESCWWKADALDAVNALRGES